MGRNMTHLMHKYNINVEDILESSKNKMNEHCYQIWKADINEKYPINALIIRELIYVKENRLQLAFSNEEYQFSYDDYNFTINYLCVN